MPEQTSLPSVGPGSYLSRMQMKTLNKFPRGEALQRLKVAEKFLTGGFTTFPKGYYED